MSLKKIADEEGFEVSEDPVRDVYILTNGKIKIMITRQFLETYPAHDEQEYDDNGEHTIHLEERTEKDVEDMLRIILKREKERKR